ncbi:hypothetical protein TWF481_002398 [Arthrobotrys musiformis]|uniref:Peptidase A1 domain-containing protein n=1 Tax=Arthrobotrys musiformis TaxID=47236 RepID=A0AAV9VT77_9PEZI
MSIGLPPQNITALVTGNQLTWVPIFYDEKNKCGYDDDMFTKNQFSLVDELCGAIINDYGIYNGILANKSGVSVFVGENSLAYYSARGRYIPGNAAVGTIGLNDIEIQNFTFLASNKYFTSAPELGLGVQSSFSLPEKVGPDGKTLDLGLLPALLRQGLIDVMGLGIYYDAYEQDINQSQITFGAVDTDKFDLPIITYPSAAVDDVGGLTTRKITSSAGNTTLFSFTTQEVSVSISEPSIRLPEAYLNPMLKALNASESFYSNKTFYADCKAVEKLDLSLSFEFSGINITLTAKDLIGKVQEPLSEKTRCRIFLDNSDNGGIDNVTISETVQLGIPFLRVAYLWLDYQNNQTSLAKAKQRVTTSNFVKIGEDGIEATLEEQRLTEAPLDQEPDVNREADIDYETDKPPVGAIAGGSVGGIAALGIVGFLIFWTIKKREISDLVVPPPSMGELEGKELPRNAHEVSADNSRSELQGSDQFSKELLADCVFPVELPALSICEEVEEKVADENRNSDSCSP